MIRDLVLGAPLALIGAAVALGGCGTVADTPSVIINEVVFSGDDGDWFELYNLSDAEIALADYTFTDDAVDAVGRSPFPEGATVPAAGYYLFRFETHDPGFGLGGDEELAIHRADGSLVDRIDWQTGDAPPGGSLGRIPDGQGPFVALYSPTPGMPNVEGDPACGDGELGPTEACDDGGRRSGDGCDAFCQVEFGYLCDADGCTPICGDGHVIAPESCDDGNLVSGDGCDPSCALEVVETACVVINEVAAADAERGDWIELYSFCEAPITLAGWTLEDGNPSGDGRPYPIAEGTMEPGSYWVLDAETTFTFGLGAEDRVVLRRTDGLAVDIATWTDGDAPEGTTWGRSPDGTGAFDTRATPTPGEPNSG